jgi:hypothetical protein
MLTPAPNSQRPDNYVPSEGDSKRRDRLAKICAEILRDAEADYVHRSKSPLAAIHLHSTMAMGKVVDTGCEAYDVTGCSSPTTP